MRARWTRLGAWARIAAVAAAVLVAGCGGDDDDDVDDGSDDQGVEVDAASDDGAEPDAGPSVDGGDTARAAEVCAVLCGAFAECSDQVADPLCDADCIDDLDECSAAEVDALEACGAGECGALEDCVLAVECAAGTTLPE